MEHNGSGLRLGVADYNGSIEYNAGKNRIYISHASADGLCIIEYFRNDANRQVCNPIFVEKPKIAATFCPGGSLHATESPASHQERP